MPNSITAITATPLDLNRTYYETHATEYCKRTASLDLEALYEPFLSQIPPGGCILDAGCGSGRDGVAFVSRGYGVTAVDASPAMVRAACERGLDAHLVTFQEIQFESCFDGIWACASLLHVPHVEMSEVLRRFARALKPRGVFYTSLKEGKGERIAEDGRFFSYFSLDEFVTLLTEDKLFQILRAWKSEDPDSSGGMSPWLNFIARRTDESHGILDH
ncbi:MAG: class I SAM-dependent methyltransferase [Candidatus Binatia bacterium]